MSEHANPADLNSGLFRNLPQLDELLRRPAFLALELSYPRALLLDTVRTSLGAIRQGIVEGRHTDSSLREALEALPQNAEQQLRCTMQPSLRAVINATGVILQTNLGRAPLSRLAIDRIAEVARGYCNLETDLVTGERGSREDHGEGLILAALRAAVGGLAARPLRAAVVNNCAAACFLALNTLAEGGEVIVSRGELVEIGGGFRVPDILRKSGAILREVGTTNRTRISDYARAINTQTRLILRVHRSNFRMEGFTEQPSLRELCDLGEQASLPVFEDQGTGCMIDLNEVGLRGESSLPLSLASGVDLVAASGDKLLGGPQCGLLIGHPAHIDQIRANPLFRAMRVDKLTYAALQGTLLEYLAGRESQIPAIGLIRTTPESLRQRCEAITRALSVTVAKAGVIETKSVIGGGTTPGATLKGFGVSLLLDGVSESTIAARLRSLEPAILARTQGGHVLFDLRAVFPEQDDALARGICQAIKSFEHESPGDAS